MELLVLIFRKMINNKWLEGSMLLGLVLTVALVSSVPIYQNAMMHRILVRGMDQIEQQKNEYPGKYRAFSSLTGAESETAKSLLEETDRFMHDQVRNSFETDVLEEVRALRTDVYPLKPIQVASSTGAIDRKASLGAMSGLEEKARLASGRFPSKETADGIYEAVVTENAIGYMQITVGDVFTVTDPDLKKTIQVKIVGVVGKQDDRDLYWYDGSLSEFNNAFLLDFSLFQRDFVDNQALPVQNAVWYFALDFSKISSASVKHILDTDLQVSQYLKSTFKNFGTDLPAASLLAGYYDEAGAVRKLLWALNVPVLFMLAFYLFMISQLIVERQKSEIAVLRSRGASRFQIIGLFSAENALLGLIALLFGPFLGKGLTAMLGASDGFLQFVGREAVQAKVTPECYLYAVFAVVLSNLLTLIPAARAAGFSIVNHKQAIARLQTKSFVSKWFLDVLLLGISGYGLFRYKNSMPYVSTGSAVSQGLRIEPALFVLPVVFMIGFGLFLQRIYPWLIRLIYWLGKRWWSPSFYSALLQVGRSGNQYQFLMSFLILTVSIGLFSASAARTINQNLEDQIRYTNGADVVLSPSWQNDSSAAAASAAGSASIPRYTEPDFRAFADLPGVEHAAKVFSKNNVSIATSNGKTEGRLLGIDTYDFGHTAWFRDDLLNYQLGEYLDLMAPNPYAVLVSKGLADRYKIKAGDTLQIGWNGVGAKSFIAYAVVDFFPGTVSEALAGSPNASMFVVGHLHTIQQQLALEPYDIWLKLTSDAARQELYETITSRKLRLQAVTDTKDSLIESRNEPLRLTLNGGLTLGFLLSLLITFVGFLLYWNFTMKGRTLQYGVLRAMGFSFGSLVSTISVEQALTSGAGLLIGGITGKLASLLYIPLLHNSFDRSLQLLPFHTFSRANDSLLLYSVVSIMILLGLAILAVFLSRIRIYRAVRLGED